MEKEKARLALEARTIDQVAPGEQQHGLGHNLQGEWHSSGMHHGRFYRATNGWFSYDFNNRNQEAKSLPFAVWGGDRNGTFDLFMNGTFIKTITWEGMPESQFQEVAIEWPQGAFAYGEGGLITVQFQAKD